MQQINQANSVCIMCDKSLSISSGRIKDLKRLAQSKAHLKNVDVRTSNNAIPSHFRQHLYMTKSDLGLKYSVLVYSYTRVHF